MRRLKRVSRGIARPDGIGTSQRRIGFAKNCSIAEYSSKIHGRARGGDASKRRKTSQNHYRVTRPESSRDHRKRQPLHLSVVYASLSTSGKNRNWRDRRGRRWKS